jgi:hypothetical protein
MRDELRLGSILVNCNDVPEFVLCAVVQRALQILLCCE